MNGETLLKGAIFCTRGEFSSAQGFYQLIRPYFKDLEFNKAKVLRRIDELIKELTQDISEIGKKEALNLLISKDLIKVKNTLENLKFNPNLEVEINEHFRLFIEICSKLGIDLSYLQLRIVDNFPSPYEKMDFWAMSYDVYDYEEFGIPIGVMIKKTHLAPWYSSSLLAHEIVHGCFAKVRLPYLARGLEDGLCDFFGSLFLCANIFGYETCQNILLNSRLSFPQSQLWFMYTESLRQVCLLYKVYGLQGILDLLRKGQSKGREIIKTIEAYCIRGLYEKIPNLSKGKFIPELSRFADYYISFPQHLVVSPMARFIAEKLEIGKNIKEILKKHNINIMDGLEAVKELQQRVYLILLDGEKVISNESNMFIKLGALRYEV